MYLQLAEILFSIYYTRRGEQTETVKLSSSMSQLTGLIHRHRKQDLFHSTRSPITLLACLPEPGNHESVKFQGETSPSTWYIAPVRKQPRGAD